METAIKICNEAHLCTIDIEGVIGVPEGEQFGEHSSSIATYERLHEAIAQIEAIEAKEVVVNIRSTGGDVNDALLIYEALTALDAHIVTRCYGYTASAATIIAQAATEGCREIAASALYLIHLSSSVVEGNCNDLSERMELLAKSDERIATLYALRSGGDKESFIALMGENGGRGRWLSPDEALAAGLVDRIIGGEESTKSPSVVERIRGWFSLATRTTKGGEMPEDINILHLPKCALPTTSTIAHDEGQRAAAPTRLASKEDPSLEHSPLAANALAYAEDARHLRFRV